MRNRTIFLSAMNNLRGRYKKNLNFALHLLHKQKMPNATFNTGTKTMKRKTAKF
jgi:hypothetical protein